MGAPKTSPEDRLLLYALLAEAEWHRARLSLARKKIWTLMSNGIHPDSASAINAADEFYEAQEAVRRLNISGASEKFNLSKCYPPVAFRAYLNGRPVLNPRRKSL